MAIYEFYCPKGKCRHTEEIWVTMEEISSYVASKCPKHKTRLIRRFSTPHLSNMSGGTSSTEKELLAKKQEQRKARSRAHFRNEKLKTIKDPHERRHFEKKFKNAKKMDHEKM